MRFDYGDSNYNSDDSDKTEYVNNPKVIMYTPYDIRSSQIVCDYVSQGNIVVCNLTTSENNQRVVDYISGGVYALGGRVEPTPVKTSFICVPKNVSLIVNDKYK